MVLGSEKKKNILVCGFSFLQLCIQILRELQRWQDAKVRKPLLISGEEEREH